VIIGLVAVLLLWPTPETVRHGAWVGETGPDPQPAVRRRWPPQAVRTARFWLAVAPAAPWVFGAASLAFVVLPQEVTRQGNLSVGYAGLITTITVASGIAVQPLARRLETRHRLAGEIAGLACAAVGTGVAIAVVGAESRAGAVGCAVAFGLAYGLCLVSGLRECERLADRGQHGSVVACFYALTYLGFGVPYLVDALNGVLGRGGTFTALAILAAVSAIWTALYTARPGSRVAAQVVSIPSRR